MTNDTHQTYRARYVFPGTGELVERGVVEVVNGVIAAVHDRPDPAAIDLGNVAIVPGLVNAHTHLEFSDLRGPFPAGNTFPDWIRSVVAHRRSRAESTPDVIQQGLAESICEGTTLLGDIATDDDSEARFPNGGPGVVVFRELLGFGRSEVQAQVDTAREFVRQNLNGNSPSENSAIIRRHGLSPHAPYSLHPDVWRESVRIANEAGLPMAAHLAETREELEFLAGGSGPFADMLREFGVWEEGVIAAGTRPLDYLRVLADADCGLVVHGKLSRRRGTPVSFPMRQPVTGFLSADTCAFWSRVSCLAQRAGTRRLRRARHRQSRVESRPEPVARTAVPACRTPRF